MLCQFTFNNYKSYKDETVFDMQAAAINEFSESLLSSDRDRTKSFVPVSVIYGPNGGGKSNLLSALSCLVTMVVNPIVELQKSKVNVISNKQDACIPFLFNEKSKQASSSFEVFFRAEGNEYRYILSSLFGKVIDECLYRRSIGGRKTAMIFEREVSGVKLGASISKRGVNTDVNPKMPYLSFLAINYNFDVITEVQKWFESCIIHSYNGLSTSRGMNIADARETKEKLVSFLNDMGIGISDYRFDEASEQFYIAREILGKSYELDLLSESEGTIKLFGMLPVILISLLEGRLTVIDELDTKLHPKLLRYIIMLFKNPAINKNGAQLLFTSHDLSTMKSEVFRRDEIWFAAKNDSESSEIYSLYEIRKEDNTRIKTTAAFDKQYLEGRYGADPYLAKMLKWEV